MQRYLLTTTIALAALAPAASAQSQSDGTGPSSFCAAEFSPAAAGAQGDGDNGATWEFSQLDLNGDGMISQSEYVECRNAGSGMDSADSDRSESNMDSVDADGNSAVSREEYMQAARRAHREAAQAQQPDGEPVLVFRRFIFVPVASADADMRGMSRGEASRRAEQQFGSLDSDGNDELSRSEWSQRAATISDQSERITASFGELDSDGDGALSQEEYGRALDQQGDDQNQDGSQTQG